jgi:hypothetical protein
VAEFFKTLFFLRLRALDIRGDKNAVIVRLCLSDATPATGGLRFP